MGCVQSSNVKVNKININENNLDDFNLNKDNKKTIKTNFEISNSNFENKGGGEMILGDLNIKEINVNYNIINQISKNESLIEYKIQRKSDLNIFKSLKIIPVM